jgi:hypothetical protein
LMLRFWIYLDPNLVREMKLLGHLSRFIRSIDEYILVTKTITWIDRKLRDGFIKSN